MLVDKLFKAQRHDSSLLWVIFTANCFAGLHSVKAAAFRDFLERHTEHDKRGKEAKFGIICALTANPGFEMLSEDNQNFLKAAKGRGAFYVVPEMAEPQTI